MSLQTPMGADWEMPVTWITDTMEIPRERLMHSLFHLAQRRLRHVPAATHGGMFLSNGAGMGLDGATTAPLWEHRTAECLHPLDFVLQVRAGEGLLQRLADELAHEHQARAIISRCQVGYQQQSRTHGFHESYGYGLRSTPMALNSEILRHHLTPHLVTRLLYTAQGGFDVFSQGAHFVLSPRAAWIDLESSGDSTCSRGIWHTRDESLGKGSRQHLLLGEAVSSDWALYLLVATTVLIIVAAAAGLSPVERLQLANPVAALHKVARDTTLTAPLQLHGGRRATALQIQWAYLESIDREVRAGSEMFPEWAPQAIAIWSEALQRLESGTASGWLEWPTKEALFRQFAEDELQMSWDTIQQESMAQRASSLSELETHRLMFELGISRRSRPTQSPPPPHCTRLMELDIHASRLGGIFDQWKLLERLDFRMPGADAPAIVRAMSHPPKCPTRANARGGAIAVMHGRKQIVADWSTVRMNDRILLLEDPLQFRARWLRQTFPGAGVEWHRGLAEAEVDFDVGDFEACRRRIALLLNGPQTRKPRLALRFLAWLAAREGQIQESRQVLDELTRQADQPEPAWLLTDRFLVERLSDLRPPDSLAGIVDLANASWDDPVRTVVDEHHAAWLLASRHGRPPRALLAAEFQQVRQLSPSNRWSARLLATLSEIKRRRRAYASALKLAQMSQQFSCEYRREIDFAEYGLLPEARLLVVNDPHRCRSRLEDALFLQERRKHYPGEARTRLLLARWTPDVRRKMDHHDRLLELANGPLRHFASLQVTLGRWEEWVSGPVAGQRPEDCWGL